MFNNGVMQRDGLVGSRRNRKERVTMAIPEGSRPRALMFRLTSGLERLDEWSQNATQVEKNVVNRVLFAVAGKTVFSEYVVVDDVARTMEFFVLAKCDLAVKVRVYGLDSFGIVYIGPAS